MTTSSFRLSTHSIVLALGAAVAGCAPAGSEGEIGSHPSGLTDENRLVYNRLVYNRLVYNRLVYNRLVYNRLDATHLALDTSNSNGIETTSEGRELLVYIARCAFAEGDVLVADHEDTSYEFPGVLGLAPEWEHQALSTAQQHVISACLLAHVNAFGQSVLVSLRGDQLASSVGERADYPVYEATFFGQVFGDEALATYACQGDDAPIALAHSATRAVRVCSDPGDPCGMVAVGRCRDVCDEQTLHGGWRGCHGGGLRYDDTVSAYLFADDPDGQNQTCGVNEDCALTAAPDTAAILDCTEGNNCTGTCGIDGICTIAGSIGNNIDAVVLPGGVAATDCLAGNNCDLICDDASCELGCRGGNNCRAWCEQGADCEIDCRTAKNCNQIFCETGASCRLWCTPGANCRIDECSDPAGVIQCADGSLVCGRPCA